jgi:hypothetical protein
MCGRQHTVPLAGGIHSSACRQDRAIQRPPGQPQIVDFDQRADARSFAIEGDQALRHSWNKADAGGETAGTGGGTPLPIERHTCRLMTATETSPVGRPDQSRRRYRVGADPDQGQDGRADQHALARGEAGAYGRCADCSEPTMPSRGAPSLRHAVPAVSGSGGGSAIEGLTNSQLITVCAVARRAHEMSIGNECRPSAPSGRGATQRTCDNGSVP